MSPEAMEAMLDRSRRPGRSPGKVQDSIERRIEEVRVAHPAWGGRKIRSRLQALHGSLELPSASTIQQVLKRRGLLIESASGPARTFIRFEHELPNDLWQMDFKGHFAVGSGRCHPLTILDDHSRFALAVAGCGNERAVTVRGVLERVFARYGLPRRILCDNGSPWGDDAASPETQLTVWLMRLGVRVTHGRPYHPQTQGKEERFHRTMNAELISNRYFKDLIHFQSLADPWRDQYNHIRPHEALDMQTPATRYQPSRRSMPAALPTIEYDQTDQVRKVDACGWISFRGQYHKIGKAFAGQPVAIRPTTTDGLMSVLFCHQQLKELDLRTSIK